MQGTLYRYPHPLINGRWIYVGQGGNRDEKHRSGASSFGRRYKLLFKDIELPNPVREVVNVTDQFELNELETIWMFVYHTWKGYSGGMNLRFPGDLVYKNLGLVGGAATKESTQGRKSNGGLAYVRLYGTPNTTEGSKKAGLKNAASGHLNRIRTSDSCRRGGLIGGKKGGLLGGPTVAHNRFHIERNRPNVKCVLCSQQSLVFAWG